MAGTTEGGREAARTNKLKYGEDFYNRNGKKGGETWTKNTKNKGFASMTFEQRREAGRRGAETRIKNMRERQENERQTT